jgi:hypothetical protein
MDSLRRYIWEYIEEGELKMANSYMDFTETTMTDTDEWLKEDGSRDWNMGTDIDTSPYYLKPLEPGYGFDESKIGKVRNGRIIVVRNPGGTLNPSGSVSTYLIRSLTDRELIITCLENLAVTTRWRAIARPARRAGTGSFRPGAIPNPPANKNTHRSRCF